MTHMQRRLRFRTAGRGGSRDGDAATAAASPDWPRLPGGGYAGSEWDEPYAAAASPSVRSVAELEALSEDARVRLDALCDDLVEVRRRETYAVPAPPPVRSVAELEALVEEACARLDVLCDELIEARRREANADPAYTPSRKAMDGWTDAQWMAAFPVVRGINRNGCAKGLTGRRRGTLRKRAVAHVHLPLGTICFDARTPTAGYAAVMLHEIAHLISPPKHRIHHDARFYAEAERLVGEWFGPEWTIFRKPSTPVVLAADLPRLDAEHREWMRTERKIKADRAARAAEDAAWAKRDPVFARLEAEIEADRAA